MATKTPAQLPRRSNGVRFFLLCALFTIVMSSAGVFHVWYNHEIYSLGHDLANQTREHRRLLDHTKKLRLEFSTLKRAQNLNRIGIKTLGLRPVEHWDWVIVK